MLIMIPSYVLAQPPVVLILGDSLSAGYGIAPENGWVELLKQRLKQDGFDYDVVNASISGDTTHGGLSRLPDAVERHDPAIVVIELGANDGLRGLSLEQIQRNIRRMIDLAQAKSSKVLLLGMKLPPNYGKRFTQEFHQLYHQLAAENSVALVPFFLEGVTDPTLYMQSDGFHPNETAQLPMLDNVWPFLEPLLQQSETN